jgi:hypothetical protein
VKGGIVPVDPISVVPDFFGLGDWHVCSLLVCSRRALLENAEYGSQARASMRWAQQGNLEENQFGVLVRGV